MFVVIAWDADTAWECHTRRLEIPWKVLNPTWSRTARSARSSRAFLFSWLWSATATVRQNSRITNHSRPFVFFWGWLIRRAEIRSAPFPGVGVTFWVSYDWWSVALKRKSESVWEKWPRIISTAPQMVVRTWRLLRAIR